MLKASATRNDPGYTGSPTPVDSVSPPESDDPPVDMSNEEFDDEYDEERELGDAATESLIPSAAVVRPAGPASPASPAGHAGTRSAAIFILSLEESVATHLLQCLSDDELAQISAEIAELGVIDKDTVGKVVEEFRSLEKAHALVGSGGMEQAVRLVRRSFSAEPVSRSPGR